MLKAAVLFAIVVLTGCAAVGVEPMRATIRFSSGALYDYIIIGERADATDGYDNAFDTISPGNLRADMGEGYLSVVLTHPEWKAPVRELRGDIRAPRARQQWQMLLRSTLPPGTPVQVALQPEQTALPKGTRLLLRSAGGSGELDLAAGSGTVPAPGGGKQAAFTITFTRP